MTSGRRDHETKPEAARGGILLSTDLEVITLETLVLKTNTDVVVARQRVRAVAERLGFGAVKMTKLVTACSELARNAVIYGRGGTATLRQLRTAGKIGLQVIFEDHGPGIDNLHAALTDGFTTGGGMGLGLPGAKRLCNEFEIVTAAGEGVRVTIANWK